MTWSWMECTFSKFADDIEMRGVVHSLSCTRKTIASRSRKVMLPLCSVLVRHTWSAGSKSGTLVLEGHGQNGASPAKTHKDA